MYVLSRGTAHSSQRARATVNAQYTKSYRSLRWNKKKDQEYEKKKQLACNESRVQMQHLWVIFHVCEMFILIIIYFLLKKIYIIIIIVSFNYKISLCIHAIFWVYNKGRKTHTRDVCISALLVPTGTAIFPSYSWLCCAAKRASIIHL